MWQQPMPVSVKVEQNVNRGVNFICALIVLAIVPILGLIRKFTFESGRWKDSMFSRSSSSTTRMIGIDIVMLKKLYLIFGVGCSARLFVGRVVRLGAC